MVWLPLGRYEQILEQLAFVRIWFTVLSILKKIQTYGCLVICEAFTELTHS